MNKKGLLNIQIAFLSVLFCQVVGAALLTPSFRVNKAVEKCFAEGNAAAYCEQSISQMNKKELLAYIRDI